MKENISVGILRKIHTLIHALFNASFNLLINLIIYVRPRKPPTPHYILHSAQSNSYGLLKVDALLADRTHKWCMIDLPFVM